jgi:arabinose-5-phosphate isomerase
MNSPRTESATHSKPQTSVAPPAHPDTRPPAHPAGLTGTSSNPIDPAAVLARGHAVLQAEVAALQDADTRLGPTFVEAVERILACRGRVCVTGVGKAGLIGAKIQATLASTGTRAYTLHPVEALHGDLGMVHGDDVVLGLSKSGSSELAELLPRVRALGCDVILLTAKLDSPAAAHADVLLDIGQTAEACPLGLAPSSSTAAMLALGDALALTVMDCKNIQPEQYAAYHPGGALGRFLLQAGEIMRTGANCPRVRAGASLRECYEVMLGAPQRAGAAMVVNEAGALAGILTHGDVFRHLTAGTLNPETPVDALMTATPKFVRAAERATQALSLMQEHAIDELPVVDEEGRLVGMIDVQDLVARGFSVFDAR